MDRLHGYGKRVLVKEQRQTHRALFSRRASRRWLLLALVAMGAGAVALPGLVLAATAAGNHSGIIDLTTVRRVDDQRGGVPCLEFKMTYQGGTGNEDGSGNATVSHQAFTYAGPVEEFAYDVPKVYQNFDGTFGDTECSADGPGYAWPLYEARIAGTNGGGTSLLCTWSEGTFSRPNGQDHIVTLPSERGKCKITEVDGSWSRSSTGVVSTGNATNRECTNPSGPPDRCLYVDNFSSQ